MNGEGAFTHIWLLGWRTEVEGVSRRTSASVEVEGAACLKGIKELVEVTVGKEQATLEEEVGRSSREALHAVDCGLVQRHDSKLAHKAVIVHCLPRHALHHVHRHNRVDTVLLRSDDTVLLPVR